MSDIEKSEVIKQKIKAKPINKKKLIRRTGLTAAMALLFGLIACVTFLVLEPVFSNLLYPKKEQAAELIRLPVAEDDMLPEDFLMDEDVPEPSWDGLSAVTQEELQAIINGIQFTTKDYRILYNKLYGIVRKFRQSMVNITGVRYDVDWLWDTYESEGSTYGVILKDTGKSFLVLADYSRLVDSDALEVVFYDGTGGEAELKKYDANTGYAILEIPFTTINKGSLPTITVATIDSLSSSNTVGNIVLAVGSPVGYSDSIAYGMITSTGNTITLPDINYSFNSTDIYCGENANGFVVNLNGQLVGIIDNKFNAKGMENLLSFVNIGVIKSTVENMMNYLDSPYIGVYGMDVTQKAIQEYGVPVGAYVKEIAMDSPAMNAGIQSGDIIVKMNQLTISSYTDYSNILKMYGANTPIELTIKRLNQGTYQNIKITLTAEVRGLKD